MTDLKSERAASAKGSPQFAKPLISTNTSTEAASAYQERSPLEIQIFVLTRRCAISVAMAEIVAPLVYGEAPNA